MSSSIVVFRGLRTASVRVVKFLAFAAVLWAAPPSFGNSPRVLTVFLPPALPCAVTVSASSLPTLVRLTATSTVTVTAGDVVTLTLDTLGDPQILALGVTGDFGGSGSVVTITMPTADAAVTARFTSRVANSDRRNSWRGTVGGYISTTQFNTLGLPPASDGGIFVKFAAYPATFSNPRIINPDSVESAPAFSLGRLPLLAEIPLSKLTRYEIDFTDIGPLYPLAENGFVRQGTIRLERVNAAISGNLTVLPPSGPFSDGSEPVENGGAFNLLPAAKDWMMPGGNHGAILRGVAKPTERILASDGTSLRSAVPVIVGDWAEDLGPPLTTSINSQPKNTAVNVGQSATFSVIAAGTPPFSYQWLKSGQPIAGASSSSLTISAVAPADAGLYSVAVTAAGGSVSSTAATLTVNPLPAAVVAPTIVLSASALTIAEKASGSVTATVTGASDTGVQWTLGGAVVASGPTLNFANVGLAAEGRYTATVTNSAGTASASVVVGVKLAAPVFTVQPGGLTVMATLAGNLSAVATSSGSIAYQWYHTNTAIAGATNSSLAWTAVQAADAGDYFVVVSNRDASAKSSVATVTVSPFVAAPVLVTDLSPTVSVQVDGTVDLNAHFSGRIDRVVVTKDSIPIVTLNTPDPLPTDYYIAHVKLTDAGVYRITVSNPGGQSSTGACVLTVAPAAAPASNSGGTTNTGGSGNGASTGSTGSTPITTVPTTGVPASGGATTTVPITIIPAAAFFVRIPFQPTPVSGQLLRGSTAVGAGVPVTVTDSLGMTYSTTTTADGRFSVSLAAGPWAASSTTTLKFVSGSAVATATAVVLGPDTLSVPVPSSSAPGALYCAIPVDTSFWGTVKSVLGAWQEASNQFWEEEQAENPFMTNIVPRMGFCLENGTVVAFDSLAEVTDGASLAANLVCTKPVLAATDEFLGAQFQGALTVGMNALHVPASMQVQFQRMISNAVAAIALAVDKPKSLLDLTITGVDAYNQVQGVWAEADGNSGAILLKNPTTGAMCLLLCAANPSSLAQSTIVGTDIVHPNGNVYSQVLLTGASTTVSAQPGKVVRLSYVDETNDIVQVEFSGAGNLMIHLRDATGPAPAVNYNQPGVAYMKGHASIVVSGADETTNVSVFSVGRITATNTSLFRSDVTYDGVADLELISITSANGKFGGVRAANASFFGSSGYTGIYAPGVQFTGPVYVEDVSASGTATPMLLLGASTDVEIAGGDLAQQNGRPVQVSGITQLKFTSGETSNGNPLPAQQNKAVLQQDGKDVTSQIVR